jgi:hypothetical protein
MNIKSLLIGSAAALVATTGARAADAIVMPEPEPVEYVRVCDMYGPGFFYIPGTETCLAISGYVWYQIGASSAADFYTNTVRARLNVDARSETEWGTLRGYIRLQGDWDPQNQILGNTLTNVLGVAIPPGLVNGVSRFGTDGLVGLDQAYITLGGLFMGYSESLWAAGVLNPGATNWGSHSWSGMAYGYQQRHSISYTFNGGNGFFGTLALEDDGNANWMPDIVGKVGIAQGWGAVWLKGAYDEDLAPGVAGLVGPRAAGLSGVDGWAASLGAQINVPNAPGSSLRLIGFYASNPNAYSVGSRWSVLASYGHQFTPKVFASVGAQYHGDTNFGGAGSPNAWRVEGQVVLTPVENFEVRLEVSHFKPQGVNGTTAGFIWFQRSF